MEETRYYKIANHIISITGDLFPLIEDIGGFDVFSTYSQSTILDVYISTNTPEHFDGYCFYFMYTEWLSIQFTNQECGYGILLKDKESSRPLLSIRYDIENRLCYINGQLDVDILRLALWLVYGLSAIETHTVAIHASAVIHKDKAVLFLGESGTGKSTQSRLWLDNIERTIPLNDDSPILQIEGNKVLAAGSPWSGKKPYFSTEVKEIAAIIRLSQHNENVIEKLNIHQAIGAIYPSFPSCIVNDVRSEKFIYSILSNILSKVPVYSLKCLPDSQAAFLAFQTLFSNGKNS